MSSSLEYLLTTLDDDTPTNTTNTLSSYPCFPPASPWPALGTTTMEAAPAYAYLPSSTHPPTMLHPEPSLLAVSYPLTMTTAAPSTSYHPAPSASYPTGPALAPTESDTTAAHRASLQNQYGGIIPPMPHGWISWGLGTLSPSLDSGIMPTGYGSTPNAVNSGSSPGRGSDWTATAGRGSGSGAADPSGNDLYGEDESIQTIDFGGESDDDDEEGEEDQVVVVPSEERGTPLTEDTAPSLSSTTRVNLPRTFDNLPPGARRPPLPTRGSVSMAASMDSSSSNGDANHCKNNLDCKPRALPTGGAKDAKTETSDAKTDSTTTTKTAEEITIEEPPHKKRKLDTPTSCCICLEIPTPANLASISGCTHPFCFECIETWAERENTCPLCKKRFYEIERVHPAANQGGMNGDGGLEGRRSKKVISNRNQRSDFGFMEGAFGGAETMWPTHIAQLLFSGLGASSLGPGANRLQAAVAMEPPQASSTLGAPAPPRVGFSSRRPTGYASSLTNPLSSTAGPEPFSDFLERVHAHSQQEPAGLRGYRETSSVFATAVTGTTAAYPTLSPFHHTTTRSTTTTTTTTSQSPWITSRSSSITSHIGPTSSRMTQPPSSLTSSLFPSLSSPTTAATNSGTASSTTTGSILGNPLTATQREREEDLLSSLSPTSYLSRIQQQLHRNSGRYQFATDTAAMDRSLTRSGMSLEERALDASFLRGLASDLEEENPIDLTLGLDRNEPGRSAETALEIDSDSDDDVEVVAVEAMM